MTTEQPANHPGLWMNAADKENCLIGCTTCEWQESGLEFTEAQKTWQQHTHGALFDIEARLTFFNETQLGKHYRADVTWLMGSLSDMLLENLHNRSKH